MNLSTASPFMEMCGIEVTRMEEYEAECTMTVAESLNNMKDMLHGGALATLIDCTAAVATRKTLTPSEIVLTTDFNMTCLRGAATGDKLIAIGRLIHRGRRLMRSDVEVFLDSEPRKLVAKAGVSFMVVNKDA